MTGRHPRSTLFPYPPLSRSRHGRREHRHGVVRRRAARAAARDGGGGGELLPAQPHPRLDRKSTRLNSSHANISYAVFCLKKKNVTVEMWSLLAVPNNLTSSE